MPEDIYSKLAVEPVLRTYLLSLIASGIIYDAKSLKNSSEHFLVHQFKDIPQLEGKMEKMLQLLEAWQMVIVKSGSEDKNEFASDNSNGFVTPII